MGYLISEALFLSILPPLILSSPNGRASAEDFAAEIHHVGILKLCQTAGVWGCLSGLAFPDLMMIQGLLTPALYSTSLAQI